MTSFWALSSKLVLVRAAPMTNIATNMTTLVLMKPLNASAGFITPVRMRARMIPAEIMENGILPDKKAMMVHSSMISVICNGVMISSVHDSFCRDLVPVG